MNAKQWRLAIGVAFALMSGLLVPAKVTAQPPDPGDPKSRICVRSLDTSDLTRRQPDYPFPTDPGGFARLLSDHLKTIANTAAYEAPEIVSQSCAGDDAIVDAIVTSVGDSGYKASASARTHSGEMTTSILRKSEEE